MIRLRAFIWLAASALLMIGSAVVLLKQDIQFGRNFPPYSSYRKDPWGTSALAGALERLPGRQVRRIASNTAGGAERPAQAVFILGLRNGWRPGEWYSEVEERMRRGDRVILGFHAPWPGFDAECEAAMEQPMSREEEGTCALTETRADPMPLCEDSPPPTCREGYPGSAETEQRRMEHTCRCDPGGSMEERWGFERHVICPTVLADEDGEWQWRYFSAWEDLASGFGHPSLFATLVLQDTGWKVLAYEDGHIAAAERPWGQGALVVMADTGPLTNAALRNHRDTELIGRLLGDMPVVAFDETALGIVERRGLLDLVRQYRLYPVFLALGVVLLLSAWSREFLRVAPRMEDSGEDRQVRSDLDRYGALAGLLRHRIKPADVLRVALEEWRLTNRRRTPLRPAERKALHDFERRASAGAAVSESADIYNGMRSILDRKGRRRGR